jgi:hypothetical protein
MFINPSDLATQIEVLEEIEEASLRLVTQALVDFREQAADIFKNEPDKAQDVAEDITREALDRMSVSRIDQRLFGKMDYKRARYVFHPEYAVRQALMVDSKAEQGDIATATLQTGQTSMRMRHMRSGVPVDEEGTLPPFLVAVGIEYLVTTIFAKYAYQTNGATTLLHITVAAVPNGMLQTIYNPTAEETIWRAGRNAPSLVEPFRVRLIFGRLKAIRNWRVQHIPMAPAPFVWVN